MYINYNSLLKKKRGFTLIEVMVAVVIIGIMAAVTVPLLWPRPADKRKEFISQFNALVALGWYNAIITHKMHKITVDAIKKHISLEIQRDEPGKLQFEPVKGKYLASTMVLPEAYEIRGGSIEGKAFGGVGKLVTDFYFYIASDGYAQDVIINFVDKKDILPSGQMRPFSLVLNPFSAQFTVYDTFQK